MRSILINSLIYNRTVTKEVCKKFEIKGIELEILAIVDSVVNSTDKMSCEVSDLRAYLPVTGINDTRLYNSLKGLIDRGQLERIGDFKRKHRFVLSGQGDYILREYSKIIHSRIREKAGKQAKRLKYSFISQD